MRISFARARSAAAALTAWSAGAALAACAALAASGCKDFEPPPAPPFQVFVRVESDPGQRVPGATVGRNNKTLATTGADGRAMLILEGAEGATTDVSIKCPDQFQSPTKPVTVRLTRFADKTKVPEYMVACPPVLRHVVVAVKADNGPNLPVMYLNRVITRTDVSGAAHFALDMAPGSQFQVTLDTTANTRIKPANPTKPFTMPQHDEVLVFDQKFEVERAPRAFVAKPSIPRPLN